MACDGVAEGERGRRSTKETESDTRLGLLNDVPPDVCSFLA